VVLLAKMTSRRSDDDETSTLGDPSVPTSSTMSTDRFTSKRSGPTLGTPLIILSALVLPSALIPLLVLRRSVNSLHRKIDELSGATRGLHHEFKSVMLELSVRKEQHEQLRVMITEMRDGHARLRRKTQRMRTAGASADEHTRAQLQELAASNGAQISRLRELGTSLADVAAFMQEIELHQGFFTPGFDGRGIERLRFLAMQLEGLGKGKSADAHQRSGTTNDPRHSDTVGTEGIKEGLGKTVV